MTWAGDVRVARLFDRLGSFNDTGPSFRRAWQRLVEALEAQELAQDIALASMGDIAAVTIAADYAGTVNAGQLPKNVYATRLYGTTDVTTASTWSFTVDSGAITATIGAATGVLNITALAASSVVTITSVYGGITKSRKLTVTKQLGAAPSSGSGGGTSASVSTFTSFSSTAFTTVSDVLTVTTGTVGQVALTAPLTVTTGSAAPAGTFPVYGIWQWDSTGGGVWVDLGASVVSSPNCYVTLTSGAYDATDGAISIAYTKTGLPASSSQKFRLQAANDTATRAMYLSGTASAVGS